MGACLCKTKRRSGTDALRPDPLDYIHAAGSSSTSSSSAASFTSSSASAANHRHSHRYPSSAHSVPLTSENSQHSQTITVHLSSNTSSTNSSFRQRFRHNNLLDALSFNGSSADLTYYLSQGKQAPSVADLLPSSTAHFPSGHCIRMPSGSNTNDQAINANNNVISCAHDVARQSPPAPSQRIWSLQSKLSMHADRLVVETLDSIKPTALNEPSNAMQKLHLISETEIGWLVVISSLINKVDLEHPFGSALILLILEDAPLPTKKSIHQLDQVLGLQHLIETGHERSVARQRNISIVLGCLAEKLAGTYSSVLFTKEVQDYLLSRIEPYKNEPIVILYSLIALEKFSQTIDNKLVIMKRLNALGSRNPLLKLERFNPAFQRANNSGYKSLQVDFIEQQVGFCATWDLDNYFLYDGRPYSYETISRANLNVMLNSRDASENLKISADGLMARNDTSRFESVRCTWAITSGIYYYEVRLITPGVMQIGFATKQSKFLNHDGFGIGDDDQSFAYDGCRQLLWQNAKSAHTDLPRWKEGDIVGCLIDLDKFEIRFSLNGRMSEANSDLFRNKPLSTQYYAAASFMPFQQCAFNFGRVPFVHPPEYHNFRTFNQCAVLCEDEKLIIPRHLILKRAHSSNNTMFMNACNICCDNAAQVTLEPCEHDGFCETCASLLDLCPLCRTTIHSRRLGTI